MQMPTAIRTTLLAMMALGYHAVGPIRPGHSQEARREPGAAIDLDGTVPGTSVRQSRENQDDALKKDGTRDEHSESTPGPGARIPTVVALFPPAPTELDLQYIQPSTFVPTAIENELMPTYVFWPPVTNAPVVLMPGSVMPYEVYPASVDTTIWLEPQ